MVLQMVLHAKVSQALTNTVIANTFVAISDYFICTIATIYSQHTNKI